MRFFTGTVGTPDAMSALDWAMAILCKAGLLSPARLDLCGRGAWHTVVAAPAAVALAVGRWGFITMGDGEGTGEGGDVMALAGETSVAVGTGSPANAAAGEEEEVEEEECCLGGTDGGLADGGCGGGRDGGGGRPDGGPRPMAEVPAVRTASDWAKSWAFLRGEAVFLEMARP